MYFCVYKRRAKQMKTEHETNKEWWKAIENVIDSKFREICESGKEKKVLDVGCSDGTNIFRLYTINNLATYYGIDIDDKEIEKAKKSMKEVGSLNIHFFKRNIITDDFPSMEFDVVLCSEVMEHLYDNEKSVVLNRINKSLKSGGFLIITTPTPECVFRKIYESDNMIIKKIVDILFENTYEDRIFEDFKYGRLHHIGVCDSLYYKKLLYRKGFKLIKIYPTKAFQYEMPKLISALINSIFIKINPYSYKFSASLVYFCKKECNIRTEY